MLGIDQRAARITWTVLAVLATLGLAWMARKTLLVFAIALLLAYLLHPVVQFVRSRLPARTPSVVPPILVYLAGAGLVVAAVLVIGTRIAVESALLATRLPEFLGDPDRVLQRFLPTFLAPYRQQIKDALSLHFDSGNETVLPALTAFGKGILSQLSVVLFTVLIPILAFLLELSLREMRGDLTALFRNEEQQKKAILIMGDIHRLLGLYVRAVFLLAMATFTTHMLTFGLIGVPYAVLLAGVCGLLEFIPVVGPLTGMITVTAVAAFSGYPHILGLIAFFLIYRLFQDYVLQPLLYRSGIEMHPLLVLFGVLAGEQIGGVSGIFLSIPILAIARVIYRRSMEPAPKSV